MSPDFVYKYAGDVRIVERDGPANGSQPFQPESNTSVIGGWLPSLTFAFGGYGSVLKCVEARA